LKSLTKIEQRLNIDLSLLKKTALDYLNAKTIDNNLKIEITNALKLSLIDILENVLTEESDSHD